MKLFLSLMSMCLFCGSLVFLYLYYKRKGVLFEHPFNSSWNVVKKKYDNYFGMNLLILFPFMITILIIFLYCANNISFSTNKIIITFVVFLFSFLVFIVMHSIWYLKIKKIYINYTIGGFLGSGGYLNAIFIPLELMLVILSFIASLS